MATELRDYKRAAIEQWSADPCGPRIPGLAPGSAGYSRRLLEGRQAYAPWMSAALGYGGTGGMTVLDVGCGQGLDLAQYALAGAIVTGIDLTPRHVELARAHLDALGLAGTVVLGDAEALAFPEASFVRCAT